MIVYDIFTFSMKEKSINKKWRLNTNAIARALENFNFTQKQKPQTRIEETKTRHTHEIINIKQKLDGKRILSLLKSMR